MTEDGCWMFRVQFNVQCSMLDSMFNVQCSKFNVEGERLVLRESVKL
jgi:hypothetical protein